MGEIQVRGPFITGSYHELPVTETSSPPTAGCAPATSPPMDELAFVRITDRTKDLIKSGGEWISSVDLENALMATRRWPRRR
jgi:fatty-acyl-CoA synthase